MKTFFMSLAVALVAGCGPSVSNVYDEAYEVEILRPKHSCCCTKRLMACMGNCGCGCESCYNAVKHGD